MWFLPGVWPHLNSGRCKKPTDVVFHCGDSDNDDAPAPLRRKFDIRKVRCHKCDLLGHFTTDCEEVPKQRLLMVEDGDDGDIMLMCELVDEEDPDDHNQLDTGPVSASTPVNPGEVPLCHPRRRNRRPMMVRAACQAALELLVPHGSGQGAAPGSPQHGRGPRSPILGASTSSKLAGWPTRISSVEHDLVLNILKMTSTFVDRWECP